MKNVCILQNGLSYGGTDTFVINLTKGLLNHGYHVTVVVACNPGAEEPREKELASTGARIVKTSSLEDGFSSKLMHFRLLFQELKKNQYDAFQTNIDLFNGPQLLIAWLAGIPVRECHSHNSQQEREVKYGRSFKVIIYQAMMRRMCWMFSNRRGGCSEAAMDFLFQNRWKKDPYSKVVKNGIDLARFSNKVRIDNKLSEVAISCSYHVLTVGRISTQKNPMFIADVFAALCRLNDDVDLIWAGTGELEQDVKGRLNRLGVLKKVKLLGRRSDVDELMKACDVFLFPSLFEGLGIVVVEAQAAGLPCVVSDAVPKMVDCGAVEFLSLSESAEIWAQSIQNILEGKKKFIADQKKLSQYSIENMVSQMETLLD